MRVPPWRKRNPQHRTPRHRRTGLRSRRLPTKSASKKVKDSMARYAIPSDKAFGVSVGDLKKMAKSLGRNHALSPKGCGRPATTKPACSPVFVDDPAAVTPNRWTAGQKTSTIGRFANTASFALFDRNAARVEESQNKWPPRRTSSSAGPRFAMMASLTVHDKKSGERTVRRGPQS